MENETENVPKYNLNGIFPQKYLNKGEIILYESRPKLMSYIMRPIVRGIVLFLFIVVPVLLLPIPAEISDAWAGFILFFFVFLPILFSILRWSHTRYALTNKRLIQTKGVFSRSLSDIPIGKVNSTIMLQPFFERIFGYGTLAFTSGGAGSITSIKSLMKSGEVHWRAVVGPVDVRNFVNDSIEKTQKELKAAEFKEMANAFKDNNTSP